MLAGLQRGCRRGAGGDCTTRGRNAHRTDECEVLYRWHPWFGRVVAVHEVIERAAGRVVRCRLTEAGSDRWLELPAWMLDRAACAPMRMTAQPRVDVGALAALQALLTEAANAGSCCVASNARVLGTGRNACDQKPGWPPSPEQSSDAPTAFHSSWPNVRTRSRGPCSCGPIEFPWI